MKLRARTTMHVGSICVRATRAPLGRAVAAEDLALQAGLDLPAKLELGPAGDPGLTVEVVRNGDPHGARDSAASLLNLAFRLFERERAGRGLAARRTSEPHGTPVPDEERTCDAGEALQSALETLRWQVRTTDDGVLRVRDGDPRPFEVGACASGYVRVGELPVTIKSIGSAGLRAVAAFALEANARLHLARVDLIRDGASSACLRWAAFVPGGGALPRSLATARQAVQVAREETLSVMRALADDEIAERYLALRRPRVEPFEHPTPVRAHPSCVDVSTVGGAAGAASDTAAVLSAADR